MSGWKRWDKNNPPEIGRYMIWDARLKDPSKIQVWNYRAVKRFEMGRRWGDKTGSRLWFNEANMPTDRAPNWYHELPGLPDVATKQASIGGGV